MGGGCRGNCKSPLENTMKIKYVTVNQERDCL